MLWFLAAIDLAAGAYLLAYPQRRERRDKPGVLAVGVTLVVCAALLGGLGTWQALQEPAEPVAPGAPDVPGTNDLKIPDGQLGGARQRR